MINITLDHKDTWKGEYKNITFEVSRHSIGDKDCWCFYLYVPIEAIPKALRKQWVLSEKDKKHSSYDYYNSPWTALEWHGDITFYEGYKHSVKVGCDYNHLFDQGHTYDKETLAHDAVACIDSLHKEIELRWRSQWDGSWHDSEQAMLDHTEKCRAEYAKKETWEA